VAKSGKSEFDAAHHSCYFPSCLTITKFIKGEFMKRSFLAGLVFCILCSSVFAREVTVTVPDGVTFTRCFVQQYTKCEAKDVDYNCYITGYYTGLFGVSEFGTEEIEKSQYGRFDVQNQNYTKYYEQAASLREKYQLGQALQKKGICSGIEIVR